MSRGDVGLVLGLAGFLLGGYAVFVAHGARSETNERWTDIQNMVKSDEDNLTGMGEKVRGLDLAHKDLTRRVNGLDAGPRGGDRVKALEDRVDALEKSRVGGAASPSGDTPKDAKAGMSDAEFDDLRKKVFSGEATNDDLAKFWATLRERPEILAGLIKEGEQAVKDRPRDKDAHRTLANIYLQKLMTVPDGMEKGVWSNKMIGEEKAIVDIDPEDWDARFSIATNYSFWPEQFNKRPDAIKEFETCRKIQEAKTPDPKHARTYLQLRQLYLKDGRTDDAKSVLDEGLRRFPDDEELKKAKDGAK